jgi:hypothetical protein
MPSADDASPSTTSEPWPYGGVVFGPRCPIEAGLHRFDMAVRRYGPGYMPVSRNEFKRLLQVEHAAGRLK